MSKLPLKPIVVFQENGKIRVSVPTAKNKKVKINNPVNHKSFALRQRNTKNGRKGQIKGRYKRSK